MQLTPEQQAVLSTNSNLVINAVAGSGKTTTLIEYAKSRIASSKILYLAFNKTVKTEAAQKFTAAGISNVKVETAHLPVKKQPTTANAGRMKKKTCWKNFIRQVLL